VAAPIEVIKLTHHEKRETSNPSGGRGGGRGHGRGTVKAKGKGEREKGGLSDFQQTEREKVTWMERESQGSERGSEIPP